MHASTRNHAPNPTYLNGSHRYRAQGLTLQAPSDAVTRRLVEKAVDLPAHEPRVAQGSVDRDAARRNLSLQPTEETLGAATRNAADNKHQQRQQEQVAGGHLESWCRLNTKSGCRNERR